MTLSATTTDNRTAASVITVADSPRAADWLEEIARRAHRPWQVRQLEDGAPQELLVLTQPGAFPRALNHRFTADRVVVSLDCPQGRSLALSSRVRTFTFSEGRDAANLTARDLRLTESGLLRFVAVAFPVMTRVTVEPDELYPALAALACAVWLGVSLELAGQVVSAGRAGEEKIIRMA